MQADHLARTLAVVALPSTLVSGTRFPRVAWPAHVTLASNFAVDTSWTQLALAVRELLADVGPMTVRFEGVALFGPNGDIPVQLIHAPEISYVHERLADLLGSLPGFAPEQARHWRAGYRPHMTRVAGRDAPEGAQTVLEHVALAEIDGDHAIILDQFSLVS